RRLGEVPSAQDRSEPATWLAARARHSRRTGARVGLFLSGPACGFRRMEERTAQNDAFTRDAGSSVRNVPCGGKNFRCTDRCSCGELLPVRRRMPQNDPVETRSESCDRIYQVAEGKI